MSRLKWHYPCLQGAHSDLRAGLCSPPTSLLFEMLQGRVDNFPSGRFAPTLADIVVDQIGVAVEAQNNMVSLYQAVHSDGTRAGERR